MEGVLKFKIVTSGAASVMAMLFASASAHAATLLSYSAVGNGFNLTWTEAASKTGGTLSTSAHNIVSVTMPGSAQPIEANLTLTGSSTTAASATSLPGGTTFLDQPIASGTFTFTAVNAFTFDSKSEAAGTVLLAGGFADANLSGNARSSLGQIDVDLGNITSISSGVNGLELGPVGEDTFALALTSITSSLQIKGQSIASFQGVSAGTFTGTAVPEPASWAMMLVGFGGLGAAMRSRRKLAAATS
jgi:PEP-CTERM motif